MAEEQSKVDAAAAKVTAAENALAAAKVEATQTERAELASYYLALHGASAIPHCVEASFNARRCSMRKLSHTVDETTMLVWQGSTTPTERWLRQKV